MVAGVVWGGMPPPLARPPFGRYLSSPSLLHHRGVSYEPRQDCSHDCLVDRHRRKTASSSHAAVVLLSETFDTDTTSRAETVATYPNLNWTGAGDPVVTGGVVQLPIAASGALTQTGFSGDLVVSLKVGSDPGGGSANFGLQSGVNRLVFHPGHSGGAFRVDGAGGFGNVSMGFTPAGGGVLHQMKVLVRADTGQHIINVIDGNNPNNLFVTSFTNPAYSPGTDTFGMTRGGSAYTGNFDDLVIERAADGAWNQVVQESHPLHWYRLDEVRVGGAAAPTTAVDYGSGGLDGTYTGGAEAGQGRLTPLGVGVEFNTTRAIQLGGASLGSDTSWTAEFVLEKTATRAAAHLLDSDPYSLSLRLEQWQNTGELGYTHSGVADYLFSPAVSAPIDEFVHVAFVGIPGTGVSLYLDGELAGTNPNFIELPRGTIGGSIDAILDEVVLYNYALSPFDIRKHAVAFTSGVIIPEPCTAILLCLGGVLMVAWRLPRRGGLTRHRS